MAIIELFWFNFWRKKTVEAYKRWCRTKIFVRAPLAGTNPDQTGRVSDASRSIETRLGRVPFDQDASKTRLGLVPESRDFETSPAATTSKEVRS